MVTDSVICSDESVQSAKGVPATRKMQMNIDLHNSRRQTIETKTEKTGSETFTKRRRLYEAVTYDIRSSARISCDGQRRVGAGNGSN
jgi:hypothetical protein